MGVFRKFNLPSSLVLCEDVIQKVKKTSVVNGVTVCSVVKEVVNTHIPDRRDYRLHDLLDAGVSLTPVNPQFAEVSQLEAETILENIKVDNNG